MKYLTSVCVFAFAIVATAVVVAVIFASLVQM